MGDGKLRRGTWQADGAVARARAGADRPGIEQTQPGVKEALERLVDPLTRGDPQSPLRWTCKSRAKLSAALTRQGWTVSSTTVGRLLHELGYSLQSMRKSQEGTSILIEMRSLSTSMRRLMTICSAGSR